VTNKQDTPSAHPAGWVKQGASVFHSSKQPQTPTPSLTFCFVLLPPAHTVLYPVLQGHPPNPPSTLLSPCPCPCPPSERSTITLLSPSPPRGLAVSMLGCTHGHLATDLDHPARCYPLTPWWPPRSAPHPHLLLCVIAALHQPIHDLGWRGLVLQVVDGTCR
jgi:hypothetical protein